MSSLLGPGATTAGLELINLGTDWSQGELVSAQLAHNVAGLRMNLLHGTSASPVTAAQPTVKVSRTEKASRAAIGEITGSTASDGAAGLCAGHFSSRGVAGSEGQAVGLFGSATNESSYEAEDGPDAAGGYFLGRITGGTSTLASSYGIVAYGRRDVASANYNGAEIGAINYTSTAESYSPGGSKGRGIWLVAGGESDSAVGIAINNPFGRQFDVGIGFGNGEMGGKVGGVKSASFRDDSTAERSIRIRGTHTKGALTVAAGAGQVIIGAEEPAFEKSLLEINGGGENRDPLYAFRATGSNSNRGYLMTNTAGNLAAFIAGGNNSFVNGSVAGDTGFLHAAGKSFFLGATGKTAVLRASEGKLAFFGTAPVSRPNIKPANEASTQEVAEAMYTLGLVE